jgi:hypothetical protein
MWPLALVGALFALVPSAVQAAQATITWQHDGQNTTQYNIERKLAGGTYVAIGSVAAGTFTYLDPTNLPPGDYCWHVNGQNVSVAGPWSPDSCATVSTAPPSGPTAPTTVTVTITVTPGAQGQPPQIRVAPAAPRLNPPAKPKTP